MIACQLGNYHIVRRLLEEPSVDVNAVDNVSASVRCGILVSRLGKYRIAIFKNPAGTG